MKKNIMAILVSALLLVSCINNTENTIQTKINNSAMSENSSFDIKKNDGKTNEKTVTTSIPTIYSLHDNYWMNNPITMDYRCLSVIQEKKYSTPNLTKLENDYYDIWDQELNNIYKKLLPELIMDHKELMISSQKGWLQMHINDHKFLLESLKNRNISVPIEFSSYRKNEIKQRTLELIHYYQRLGYDYKYLYIRNLSDLDQDLNVHFLGKDENSKHPIFKLNPKAEYRILSTNNIIDVAYLRDINAITPPDFRTKTLECLTTYSTRWDDELNSAYSSLAKSLSPSEKESLLSAQLGWIEFKTNDREFFKGAIKPISGTNGIFDSLFLGLNTNKERTLEIMEYEYVLNGTDFEFIFDSDFP